MSFDAALPNDDSTAVALRVSEREWACSRGRTPKRKLKKKATDLSVAIDFCQFFS